MTDSQDPGGNLYSDLSLFRHGVVRGTPFGPSLWQHATAVRLGLESLMRLRGWDADCPASPHWAFTSGGDEHTPDRTLPVQHLPYPFYRMLRARDVDLSVAHHVVDAHMLVMGRCPFDPHAFMDMFNLPSATNRYEWFNTTTDAAVGSGTVKFPGATNQFTPPFNNNAVLYFTAESTRLSE